jgi:phosphoglycerate dehydrogenase-like enzyme
VFKRSDSIDNLSEFNTLVVAVQPEGNDNLINDSVLKNFKGKLISVSRSNVIDNYALHENINNISHAYVDTLDSNLREELLETKKVTYTKHTAFEYNFTYENNTQYFTNLQNTIDKCLDNNIDNAILSRGERVLF